MQEGPASLLLGLAIGRHVLAAMHAEGGIYAMSSNVTGLTTIDGFALFFVYFVSGHVFRQHIFAYADRIAARWGVALASLLLWGVLEALSVGAGLPEVPGLTLVFGFAGAGAVIASLGAAREARCRALARLLRPPFLDHLPLVLRAHGRDQAPSRKDRLVSAMSA